MSELNREQIIKALECCRHSDSSEEYCADCPYYTVKYCAAKISEDTLSLIKELTEENERLRAEQSKIKRKVLMEAASKFAGHSDYHGDAIVCKLICMAEGKEVGVANPIDEVRRKETRADTVRNMQERLKEKSELMPMYSHLKIVYTSDIDQIAKEMLEGE